MKNDRVEKFLVNAPEFVRRSMLENADDLPPGAAAVTGRFFTVLRLRREPFNAPGPGAFLAAAKSESTLATLLRMLTTHAPQISTAAGRGLRKEYYKQRGSSKEPHTKRIQAPLPTSAPDGWPGYWRQLWPSLRSASIRDSSKRRYLASISRCARLLPHLDLPPGVEPDRPGYFLGHCLGEALAEKDVRNRTIAGYLDGLVALMRHGGADEQTLDGLRAARDHFQALGRAGCKLKHERIRGLMEQGGFAYIVEQIRLLRDKAKALPDHSAKVERLRQTVAILMILVNKPARTADMASWRVGEQLQRDHSGGWTLRWCQSKTCVDTEAGALWPETCEILDELTLGGRPVRFAAMEYQKCIGMNWLTGTVDARSQKLPSQLVREAIGVPAHDLRTLAADYLRLHDPAVAVATIQSHLGHGSRQAGDEYRSLADGDLAAVAWRQIRQDI